MANRRKGGELYYLDENGERQDASLHEEILNNPEANRKLSEMAIERAVKRGIPRDEAERIYGLPVVDVVNAQPKS